MGRGWILLPLIRCCINIVTAEILIVFLISREIISRYPHQEWYLLLKFYRYTFSDLKVARIHSLCIIPQHKRMWNCSILYSWKWSYGPYTQNISFPSLHPVQHFPFIITWVPFMTWQDPGVMGIGSKLSEKVWLGSSSYNYPQERGKEEKKGIRKKN